MADVLQKDGKFFEKSDDGKYHEIPAENFVPALLPKEDKPSTLTGQLWSDENVDLGSKIIGSIATVPMDATVGAGMKVLTAVGDFIFGESKGK